MQSSYRLSSGTFTREAGNTEPKRLFFIAAEGTNTETSYLRQLNANLKDMGCADAVIHVLGRSEIGRSGVADVYALLEECYQLRKNQQLLPLPAREELEEQFTDEDISLLISGSKELPRQKIRDFHDSLLRMGLNLNYRQYLKSRLSTRDWFVVVLDRDYDSHDRESLQKIIQKCQRPSFLCCLTNPCIEFWLLLHLVNANELLIPDELGRILNNKKVSCAHTYVSKWVSDLAHHSKDISPGKFKSIYKTTLQKARLAAKRFAQTNDEVLDKVGTTITVLMDELFGPLP